MRNAMLGLVLAVTATLLTTTDGRAQFTIANTCKAEWVVDTTAPPGVVFKKPQVTGDGKITAAAGPNNVIAYSLTVQFCEVRTTPGPNGTTRKDYTAVGTPSNASGGTFASGSSITLSPAPYYPATGGKIYVTRFIRSYTKEWPSPQGPFTTYDIKDFYSEEQLLPLQAP